MKIYKIKKVDNTLLKNIDVDSAGIEILLQKSEIEKFYIKDLKVGGANILKQYAMSVGADLAVPKGTIIAKTPLVNAVLMATKRQIKEIIRKIKNQPFGLNELSKELKLFLDTKEFKTKIMGVINTNDDSFFQGSRFVGTQALKKIEQMIEDKADIIDIGAVSSRPGSKSVDEEEELNRIKPVIDLIKENKLYEKVKFSIDSYTPNVIKYALDAGFDIVNDITGLNSDEVAKIVSKYNATIVIMHMQGTPQTMQLNPTYENVILDIEEFFKNRIEKASKFGINDIILDVGIGFGKKLEHNINLLKNLEHFKKFGYELLIGASRKSLIDMITPSKVEERLPGTLALHLCAIENGASIIRCHDVKEHYQAIRVYEALNNF